MTITQKLKLFTLPGHWARLRTAMHALGKVDDAAGKLDPEYASALYILCADQAFWQSARKHVSRHGIDIDALLKTAHATSEGVLVRLAGNLFSGCEDLNALELLYLDESNFHMALSAIWIRYHGLPDQEGGEA